MSKWTNHRPGNFDNKLSRDTMIRLYDRTGSPGAVWTYRLPEVTITSLPVWECRTSSRRAVTHGKLENRINVGGAPIHLDLRLE